MMPKPESTLSLNESSAQNHVVSEDMAACTPQEITKLTEEILGLVSQVDMDLKTENANKDGHAIPTQRDLLAGIVSNTARSL